MSAQVPTPEQHRVKVEAIRRLSQSPGFESISGLPSDVRFLLAAFDSVVAQRDEARQRYETQLQATREVDDLRMGEIADLLAERKDLRAALDRVRALVDTFSSAGSAPFGANEVALRLGAALSGPTGTPDEPPRGLLQPLPGPPPGTAAKVIEQQRRALGLPAGTTEEGKS